VRWTVTAVAGEAWTLFLVQPLHAFTFAAGHTALIYLIARSVPAEASATAQGLFSSLALGGAIGVATLIAGWLYERAGGNVFLAMTAMSLAGGIMIVPLARTLRARLAG
jgi:PPP family 3-phenylpropionic acid transporter